MHDVSQWMRWRAMVVVVMRLDVSIACNMRGTAIAVVVTSPDVSAHVRRIDGHRYIFAFQNRAQQFYRLYTARNDTFLQAKAA